LRRNYPKTKQDSTKELYKFSANQALRSKIEISGATYKQDKASIPLKEDIEF
jgi:hypothetical protein